MSAHIIQARGVNAALHSALDYLGREGVEADTRNGRVIAAPGPVLTEYERPQERVLFCAARNANPYFHLMESIWMLAGREDVAWVSQFNQRMRDYSDDGVILHGAYGYRWRARYGIDQLANLIKHLSSAPNSRRAVLAMWTPSGDLVPEDGAGGLESKDLPCNTHIYFALRGGALETTVCNRSNDAIWGAYGANAVHFSMLQEWLAAALGAKIGRLYQFSNNLHVYRNLNQLASLWGAPIDDRYASGAVSPMSLLQPREDALEWLEEAQIFCEDGIRATYFCEFFSTVAIPMLVSWRERRSGKNDGRAALAHCAADDWRAACEEWIERKEQRKEAA